MNYQEQLNKMRKRILWIAERCQIDLDEDESAYAFLLNYLSANIEDITEMWVENFDDWDD